MRDVEEPPARDTQAPFGAPVPRIYRKHPEEALTAQAYFYLFWWYRAWLALFVVGTWLLVAAIGVLVAGAPEVAGVLGVVAVTIQVFGGLGWAYGRTGAPKDNMALYVDSEEPAQ